MKERQIDEVFMDVHVITFSYRVTKTDQLSCLRKNEQDDYVSMIKGWHSTLCKN